jgi:hypothetical protein
MVIPVLQHGMLRVRLRRGDVFLPRIETFGMPQLWPYQTFRSDRKTVSAGIYESEDPVRALLQ